MTTKEFCKQRNITEAQFYGTEKIGGSLYLSSLTSIPAGLNPTVGGYLDLSGLTSIPEGFNPTVGGSLDLGSLTSIPEGFNPTVGGSLYLGSLTSIPEGFNPTVGGDLDLRSLTSIPEGFNPTVGGSLYLRSLTSIPAGFNPTVGWSLYLSSLTSIPAGFNPTVGGYLDLRSLTSEDRVKVNETEHNGEILSWQDGRYILADGIFTEVLEKKGRTYRVKKIGNDKVFYLVTDGKTLHSHGDTLKQAKEDLRFKRMAEKLKNEPITADTVITTQHYRIITGACESGVRNWMEQNGIKETSIKAGELLPLLEKTNAYGLSRFKELMK